MIGLSNVKFMDAVMRWLALFPSSPISTEDSFTRLANPQFLTMVIRVLIGEGFHTDTSMDSSVMDEYALIFHKVEGTFRQGSKMLDKIRKYMDLLQFNLLSAGDLFPLNILCLMLLDIGLHSCKASILVSTVSMLSGLDQLELKPVIYDSQDLTVENLILTQKIHLMELENSQMKMKLCQSQLNDHRTDQRVELMEHQWEAQLREKDLECDKLYLEIIQLKATIKELQYSLVQWNEDFKQLNVSKSPIKRVLRTSHELDVVKWQYNLLSELIVRTL